MGFFVQSICQDRRVVSEQVDEKGEVEQLLGALTYLGYAIQQLHDARLWSRLKRFERHMLRFGALLRNVCLLGVLSLMYRVTGCSWTWAFSFGVLTFFVPFLSLVWFRAGGEEYEAFLSDVHYSDEVVIAFGEPTLLEWPLTHPELAIEEGCEWEDLLRTCIARRDQLQAAIRDYQSLPEVQSICNESEIVPDDE
jgi:hypothetical protein